MTTTRPRASSSCTRNGRTSTIRASTWRSLVMMPDWLPVKLIASPPRSRMAVDSSAIDIRPPAGRSMARRLRRAPPAGGEQHVELRARGVCGDLLGKRQQLIRRVAHRRHDDDDIVSGVTRPHDTFGDLPQPGHVGNAGAAVL